MRRSLPLDDDAPLLNVFVFDLVAEQLQADDSDLGGVQL
jgi:hypothetical protein